MKGLKAALFSEFIKVRKSKMFWITLLFFSFIAVMMGFLMLIAKHPEIAGNSEVLSTKASLISKADWPTYFGLLLQMALVLGVLGPGIVTIWIFGREYSDRVIKDLLALPVPRETIVLSKFIIAFIWSFLLMTFLLIISIISGLMIHLDGWSRELFLHNSLIFMVSSFLTILLISLVALITCLSRGFLLPVGYLILTMIVTQFVFVGVAGITPYFPWAIPGLISGVAGPLNPKPEVISYFILGGTSILGMAGTAAWWKYADQH